MREIKFRAWDKAEKKMRQIAMLYFEKDSVAFTDSLATLRRFAEIELMQFTGLKDKNGRDVYEGDILRRVIDTSYDTGTYPPTVEEHTPFIEEVKWVDELTGFYPFCEGYELEDIEILGNIHENPELLSPELRGKE